MTYVIWPEIIGPAAKLSFFFRGLSYVMMLMAMNAYFCCCNDAYGHICLFLLESDTCWLFRVNHMFVFYFNYWMINQFVNMCVNSRFIFIFYYLEFALDQHFVLYVSAYVCVCICVCV